MRFTEKIKKMIEWSQASDFWSGNILSTEKLRKQYTILAVQANNEFKQNKKQQQEKNYYGHEDIPKPF